MTCRTCHQGVGNRQLSDEGVSFLSYGVYDAWGILSAEPILSCKFPPFSDPGECNYAVRTKRLGTRLYSFRRLQQLRRQDPRLRDAVKHVYHLTTVLSMPLTIFGPTLRNIPTFTTSPRGFTRSTTILLSYILPTFVISEQQNFNVIPQCTTGGIGSRLTNFPRNLHYNLLTLRTVMVLSLNRDIRVNFQISGTRYFFRYRFRRPLFERVRKWPFLHKLYIWAVITLQRG